MDEKRRIAFLNESLEVCKKHGLSIAHEDTQGAFIIRNYNENDAEWLMAAIWKYDYGQ